MWKCVKTGVMSMAKFATLIIVVLLGSLSDRVAWGADAPQGYICNFEDGGAWTFQAGKFLPEGGKNLKLEIRHDQKSSTKATLKTSDGSSKLKRVAALDADHYLEVTVGGYLNITTIFNSSNEKNGFPAVHSRHLGILGRPIVSQFRGICRAGKGP